MKRYRLYSLGIILSTAMLWTGCATEDGTFNLNGPENDSGVPITIENVWIENNSRATNLLGNFNSFTVYGFNVTDTKTSLRLKDVTFTKSVTTDPESGIETSTWKASKSVSWPKNGTMEFYALAPGMKEPYVTDVVMNANDDKTMHHAIPAECTEQVDLLYAISRKQTLASHGGSISLTFSHALSTLTFSAKNMLGEGFKVTLYGLKIYNLKNEGTLLFDGNSAKWTVDNDKYADYTLMFNTPIEISAETYDNLTPEEYFMGMPQAKSVAYSTTGEDGTATSFATAYADRQVILGVLCKIEYGDDHFRISPEDVPGEYDEVYFSYGGRKWNNGMTYATKINFNGGFNKEGKIWLEEVEIGGVEVKVDKNWIWKGINPIEVEEWPTDPDVTTELQF